MNVTVAICTWNRAQLLDWTLDGLGRMEIPAGVEWELLVVNNNCTDDTDSVVKRHAERLPIRYLHEPKQGLSNSRNCALEQAAGDVILWTDDDIQVDSGWLRAYVQAARGSPELAFFGGPIGPHFDKGPPDWLQRIWDRVGTWYGMIDLGAVSIPLDKDRLPFGANYAVRVETHRRYPYDPNLGVKGHSLLSGEETHLFHRLLEDSHQGRWVPGARIVHYIPQRYQTIGYLRKRSFYYG